MGRRDQTGLHTNTVGWTLEAAPFVGPAFAYPNNTSLEPFAFAHGGSDAIDLALGALDDPGLLADVDRHRALIAKEATFCQGPSHGGSYMDKGMFHIRIRLLPYIVPGDCLAFSSFSMPLLLFARACPMSDDSGLY